MARRDAVPPILHSTLQNLYRKSSNNGTAGGSDYDVAVGICGNKMAICTFSGNLSWPWSTQIGGERPASAAVDATSRLIMYRNILSSPAVATSPQWQDLTNFLPDCRLEFRCCVDSSLLGGINHDVTVGICGHGMSICTQRQGSWPFGNDSSVYWQTPYTSARLQVYRNAYSISNASGTTDIAIGNCGNRMAICTHESVLWPHTDDTTAAYTEPYDARWQRYANVVSSVTRWQDITRFSLFCIDKFFECFYTSSSIIEHLVVVPSTYDSYRARLGLYRAMFENMALRTSSYAAYFPVLITLVPTHTSSVLLSLRHQSALNTLLPGRTLTLRFRATRDGWSSSTFHTMCDGVAPHFAVFRTTPGFMFTAYATVAFTTSNLYYRSAPSGSSWAHSFEGPGYSSSVLAGASSFQLNELEFFQVT
ncbi:hypothetical protein BKA69DRAFT_1126303 [Paraphysoderma sedebokerense]|nr:hypothetical protein BKA69DRAFT_1126303 [Paraphysoderma sedebokerense]